MSRASSSRSLSLLITALAVLAVVKLAWVGIAWRYLPEQGVSAAAGQVKHALHYRYRLASDVALPKLEKRAPKKVQRSASIKNLKLVGIYSSSDNCIVTLLKKSKSYVLSKGEALDGFVLKGASAREAYFEKGGKRYTLKLFESKRKGSGSITESGTETLQEDGTDAAPQEKIATEDGVRVVPRSLFKQYVEDMDKAMHDIGLRPLKRENQMIGYKVRFIRKGSPISQLGLQRGDIIKAINGEEIVDFNGPMNILKSADTIEGLTLTVIRKNEEKELEYEVK